MSVPGDKQHGAPSDAEVLKALGDIFPAPAVRLVFEQPVVRKMLDLDVWGQEQGLDSEMRADIVRTVSMFFSGAPDADAAREYVRRVADVLAEAGLGPERKKEDR